MSAVAGARARHGAGSVPGRGGAGGDLPASAHGGADGSGASGQFSVAGPRAPCHVGLGSGQRGAIRRPRTTPSPPPVPQASVDASGGGGPIAWAHATPARNRPGRQRPLPGRQRLRLDGGRSRRPSPSSTASSTRRRPAAGVRRHRGVLSRRCARSGSSATGWPRAGCARPRRRGDQGVPRTRKEHPLAAAEIRRGGRAVAAQPADRPDRPLLRPLRRPDDAARGVPDGVRRAGAGRARCATWRRRTTRPSG